MSGKLIFIGLTALVLWGCDSKNPASVRAEREGMPTPTMPPRLVQQRQAPQHVEPQIVEQEAPIPTLRPGKEVIANTNPLEATLKPIKISEAIQNSSVTVAPWQSGFERIFDGDTTTLYRTDGVNPIVLTFTFKEPVNLKTVRVFPSYSSYDWAVYLDGAEKGLVIKSSPEEQWSRLDLEKAAPVKTVRVEVLRLQRDNYVHLNEVEFYTE